MRNGRLVATISSAKTKTQINLTESSWSGVQYKPRGRLLRSPGRFSFLPFVVYKNIRLFSAEVFSCTSLLFASATTPTSAGRFAAVSFRVVSVLVGCVDEMVAGALLLPSRDVMCCCVAVLSAVQC